jgi:hypothetical protein
MNGITIKGTNMNTVRSPFRIATTSHPILENASFSGQTPYHLRVWTLTCKIFPVVVMQVVWILTGYAMGVRVANSVGRMGFEALRGKS